MQIWMTLILAVQLLSALAMIGLVLIQHGKGADMGASFGSGASGSLFGATGSANFLSRSTAALATVFFCCTLALAYMSSNTSMRGSEGGGSVLDRAPRPRASAPGRCRERSRGDPRCGPCPAPSQAPCRRRQFRHGGAGRLPEAASDARGTAGGHGSARF
ncbi:MAG: preprotein translocase subunit SecG [Rubrivivax sp.]|nr:preprotein translocase subunit SecG [Rubrivivax sp.]